jgi:hypothetical protein
MLPAHKMSRQLQTSIRFLYKLWDNHKVRFAALLLFLLLVVPLLSHRLLSFIDRSQTSWIERRALEGILGIVIAGVIIIVFAIIQIAYESLLDLVDDIKLDWKESKNEVIAIEQMELKDDHHIGAAKTAAKNKQPL